MSTIVLLTADTHLPRFGWILPRQLLDAADHAQLILHAGDLTDEFVLEALSAAAPTVAVAGNNDGPELTSRLGTMRVAEVEGVRIGLTHGHLGSGRTTPDRAVRTFAEVEPPVHAVAFGHSHQPMVERRGDLWLLNPGSPTDRRRQPEFSFVRLVIEGDHLEPELVTYPRWR